MVETLIVIVLGYGAGVALMTLALRRAGEPLRSWGASTASL